MKKSKQSKKQITNLVLGSDGFIGKAFCHYLESIGEKVVRFDIKNDEKNDARTAKLNFDGIDRVYFLAWDVGGAKYLYKEDAQIFQLDWNLKLLLNTMPQLQASRIPFLFISSQLAEEYDTVYGVTKRLGEVWTRLLNGTFIRQWNVYGPIEEHSIRSHVVSDFVYQAVNTGKIEMMTTGEEKRQFIHIEDVCRAWHHALSSGVKGIHDVTSFEWVKIIDIANLIGKLTGAQVIPGPKVGSTPLTPIKGKLHGWHPQVTLEEGLKKIISELKKPKSKAKPKAAAKKSKK
jgi:nucleoside-diphosphate-sugar epimerase